MNSKVYLLGAGPGSPDLLTIRGKKILDKADVVIYDYLVNENILDYADKDAEFICCDEISKRKGAKDSQSELQKVNEMVLEKARQGKNVVRLKNGDSTVFSRLSGEIEALLEEDIEFEIVPGITAGSAAASLSGIPLTDRGTASSVTFLTGTRAKNSSGREWENIAKMGTIVLYMSVGKIKEVTGKLISAGKDEQTPVAAIQEVSLPTQKIVSGTLQNIASKVEEAGITPPAIFIVGEVVDYQDKFNWTENNRKILFTGLSDYRPFLQGNYYHVPLIKIIPLEDYQEFDREISKIEDYDWLVFTSRYGVKYFFERFFDSDYDVRKLADLEIAAIGSSTAGRLRENGVIPDLIPERQSSTGLIKAFENIDIKGKDIFMPRSNISAKGLDKGLRRLGANVKTKYAYKNVVPDDLPDLDIEEFDEIMFTSPSTVRSFKDNYGKVPESLEVQTIGKVTQKEVEKWEIVD